MRELNEDKLEKVVGGEHREKTINVSVQVENVGQKNDIDVIVYVDGEYRRDLSRTIDPSVLVFNVQLKGTNGIKRLDIKFNNELKKSYNLNFENGTYVEII